MYELEQDLDKDYKSSSCDRTAFVLRSLTLDEETTYTSQKIFDDLCVFVGMTVPRLYC